MSVKILQTCFLGNMTSGFLFVIFSCTNFVWENGGSLFKHTQNDHNFPLLIRSLICLQVNSTPCFIFLILFCWWWIIIVIFCSVSKTSLEVTLWECFNAVRVKLLNVQFLFFCFCTYCAFHLSCSLNFQFWVEDCTGKLQKNVDTR